MILKSVAGGGYSRRDSELAVDRSQVPVDRARADDQLFGYLCIGEALCDEIQYLHLAGSQAERRGGMRHGNGWRRSRRSLGEAHRDLWREGLRRGERLCGGHGAPFGPGLFEGWLAQLVAHHSHHAFVESWRDGYAAGFAQGLGCPPK